MKGQVSTELLIIVGAIVLLFIPILGTVYLKSLESQENMASLQYQFSLGRLANWINSIGSMGEGSSLIADIYLPKSVSSVQFLPSSLGKGGEVIFFVRDAGATAEHAQTVSFAPVNSYRFDYKEAGNARFKLTVEREKIKVERLK